MTNFRMPYFSTSLSEFWQRWHISLSTWFRDYVYFPLGGNRVAESRWMLNILIVFGLSGLWHGASWTFVIWGAIHGIWLILERVLSGPVTRLINFSRLEPQNAFILFARWALVFGVVICSWVFFKATSIQQAVTILSGFLNWRLPSLAETLRMGLPVFELGLAVASILLLAGVDAILCHPPLAVQRAWGWRPVRWATYVGGFYFLVFFAVLGRVEFIYFQF